jgi:hypothetical protein
MVCQKRNLQSLLRSLGMWLCIAGSVVPEILKKDHWTAWFLKLKALSSFETSGSILSKTKHHIPKEVSLQRHLYEKFKPHNCVTHTCYLLLALISSVHVSLHCCHITLLFQLFIVFERHLSYRRASFSIRFWAQFLPSSVSHRVSRSPSSFNLWPPSFCCSARYGRISLGARSHAVMHDPSFFCYERTQMPSKLILWLILVL